MKLERSKKEPNQVQESQKNIQELPKYPQPKILLIDLEDEVEKVLKVEGYNVLTGSFGTPYRVEKRDGFEPVIINGSLPPNYAEQEIVVIDLMYSDILENWQGEKHTTMGENDWWASCSEGVIDPKPRLMARVQSEFDRILSSGGIFVIFAISRNKQKLIFGNSQYGLGLRKIEDISYDNWSFLAKLDRFNINHERGEEIRIIQNSTTISSLLTIGASLEAKFGNGKADKTRRIGFKAVPLH